MVQGCAVIESAGFDAAVEVGVAAFCADGSATRTRAFALALGAQLNFFADRPQVKAWLPTARR